MDLHTDITLNLRAEPRLLHAVRALVRAYVVSQGFDRERCDDVVLAVDEACTNAVRHAYGGPCDEPIALTMQSSEEWVQLTLCDRGQTAPPEKVRRKPVEAPDPERLTPGGLGVQLIYTVFDEAEFAPNDPRGNCVIMRLKRTRP